jgi:GNAT superfamily N-acetyltransferase
VEIALATPDDVKAMAALAEEMDRFYGATEVEPLQRRLEQIREALFGEPPAGWALLAWQQRDHATVEDGSQKLVGFASYSFLWPAVGLTRSLFLKELYVVDAARSCGVGTALMQALFEVARQHECSRVEWQTEVGNAEARGSTGSWGWRSLREGGVPGGGVGVVQG